ncbi:hypothetical protein DsansV1_C21g0167831 [Dioscorea sansibarensis]
MFKSYIPVVNFSLVITFGDMISEYAAFCISTAVPQMNIKMEGKAFYQSIRDMCGLQDLVIDGDNFPSEESNIKFSNFVDQVLTLHDE